MSILLHHFKELTQCVKEVEQIEARINSKNKGGLLLTREHEEEKEQQPPKPRPAAALQGRLQKQSKLSEF
jgi:hypothetical protein